ncbi:MAG TPA: DUF1501 domain-containing protein [Planctomycetota bacterium]|nr:DUF1501 domain-containing protein [Planctomycetota bacterium]
MQTSEKNHGSLRAIDRRELLGGALIAGGALAASTLVSPLARAFPAPLEDRKTKRIVVIAFAGGVRTRETFGSADNVPNLKKLAARGVLYPKMRSSNLGHYGAALSMFTGIAEQRGIRENQRGDSPTLFEYLRKDLNFPGSDVWIATSGGAQQTNYSYGLHAQYGARYGANTLDSDGLFNAEFRSLVAQWGRPKPKSAREDELLARLRGALESPRLPDAQVKLNSPESAARVEKYILEELTRGTAEISGPNAADAKALRVARNLLAVFKPRVVGVVLQQADVAHASFNGYAEIVRRNDESIGELVAAIDADPELARSTAIFIAPEFGRDRDLNSRRGLDHGDGSDDLNFVTGLAVGPDFRRGVVVDDEVAVIDVCPTVCSIFGTDAKLARGRKLPKLFA